LLNTFNNNTLSGVRWAVPAGGGASVLTNGDFSSALTGWTSTIGSGGSITESGGVVTFVSDGGTSTALTATTPPLTAGKSYSVTVVINSGSGTLKIVNGTKEVAGIGVGTSTFNLASDGTNFVISRTAGVACNLLIDSISVKEAAIQVTTTTGLDNVANSASRLTAAENDATILQLLTAATGTRTTSAWIKAITLTQKPELSPGGGTFDSSFGWTLGSWTIGGGVASIVASPGSILRIASSPAALGKVFVFSYTITSISGANVQAHAGGTLGVLRSTPGTYTESIVCGSVDTLVGIAALSGATATIDNLSIKESAISLTRNGGTGWTDITSSLVAGTWVPVEVTSDVGANPTVGLKMGTSGDVIDVDCFQDENGAWRTSPILTTTAAVTRNADVLSYTHAGILDDAQGTILVTASVAAGQTGTTYVLSTSGAQFPLYKGNSGANLGSADGTTTLFGAAWANDGISRKCAVNWSGVSRKVCMNGGALNSGAYDGSWNATALYPGSAAGSIQISGNIGEVHIWTSALTDAQMQQVTT